MSFYGVLEVPSVTPLVVKHAYQVDRSAYLHSRVLQLRANPISFLIAWQEISTRLLRYARNDRLPHPHPLPRWGEGILLGALREPQGGRILGIWATTQGRPYGGNEFNESRLLRLRPPMTHDRSHCHDLMI